MSEPLSAKRLAEIRARVEAATEGPWEEYAEYGEHFYAFLGGPYLRGVGTLNFGDGEDAAADLALTVNAREDLRALLAEVELLHVEYGKLQRSLNQYATELSKAQADVDADLPRLRADLKGWSERGRKAEDELEAARIEIAELKARAEAGPDTAWFLALYEGAEPELFATEAAAKACCDDLAAVNSEGGDWLPEADGVWQQVRTRDLDDAVVGEAPGSVWRLSVQGAAVEAGGR